MTPLPIPLSAELWSSPELKIPGEAYPIIWNRKNLPVEVPILHKYFVVDTDCTWEIDWTGSQTDLNFVADKLVHRTELFALYHRLCILKTNLNALRSVFSGSCVMANTLFRAPHFGDIDHGTKVWCVGISTPSKEIIWEGTVPHLLLRAYGLLHLNQQECVMHRQCLVEANLRGVKNAYLV